MSIELFLSLIAVATAFIGLLASLRQIVRKMRAERECLRLLSSQPGALYIPRDELVGGNWSFEELHKVVSSIDRATVRLSPRDRRLIAEGLHQRSALGRARYAAKLLKAAGVTPASHRWVTH
jgi:hypothetical protein